MKHFNHLLNYNLEISPCFDFYGTDRQHNYRFYFETSLICVRLDNCRYFNCGVAKRIKGLAYVIIWKTDLNQDEQEVDAYLEAKQLEFAIGKAIKTTKKRKACAL